MSLNKQMKPTLPVSSPLEKLRASAYHYLGPRQRTQQELSQFLKRKALQWGASPEEVEIILSELKERQLIDDQGFGRQWVQSKLKGRLYGPRILSAQLRTKGLNSQSIQEILEDVPLENWQVAAKKTLEKYRRKWIGLSGRERVFAQQKILYTRGFSLEISRDVIDELTATE